MSSAIASTQSAHLREAVRQRRRHEQPDAERGAHGETRDRARRSGSSRLARTNSDDVRDADAAVGDRELEARSPKASGTAIETIRNAAIAANMASRTAPSSGSTTLVSHA